MVAFPTPACAAMASIVKVEYPDFSSKSMVALRIAILDDSLRGLPTTVLFFFCHFHSSLKWI